MARKIAFVLHNLLYDENLGYVARLCKNFDINELFLIKCVASKSSKKALQRAMNAKDVLQRAKVIGSLSSLKKDFLLIGTTAKERKPKKFFRNPLPLQKLIDLLSKNKKNIAFVFGNEKNGLSLDVLNECHIITTIESSNSYRALSISHAAAIIAYFCFTKLKNKRATKFKEANEKTLNFLYDFAESFVERNKKLKNKKAAKQALKKLLFSGLLTEKEAKMLITLFSE